MCLKCFEILVWSDIMPFVRPTFNVHQFEYRANRSAEDAVAAALHVTLSHLELQQGYVHLPSIDFSINLTDWCTS